MGDAGPLVVVTNAYKRYTPKNVVLAGLNMTIERGTIYGLLGPSGCGKSTLLSCIVGRLSLDVGRVKVCLNNNKEIGYMPQDLSLNTELSIGEQLILYGRIFLMSWEKIDERMKDLTELLDLPPANRLVSECSGGQQRRISMAIALIHDPELLILDEPTVGIDPLLCASIWECFMQLVKERGKTILITTHYIEEAKSANTLFPLKSDRYNFQLDTITGAALNGFPRVQMCVVDAIDFIGLMRNGVLLAENSPHVLMEKFDCDTLEDVFLELSQKQGENFTGEYPTKQKQEPHFTRQPTFNKMRFMAQLRKNWIWTKQNLGVTLFVMLIPTLCLTICCSANLADILTVPVAVVTSPSFKCHSNSTPIRQCLKVSDFTCRYIEILRGKYPLELYHNYDEAWIRAKKGYLAAILNFHANFTEALMDRIEQQGKTSATALEQSTMYSTFDMSSYPTAHSMMGRVYDSLEELLYEICSQCGINKKLARIPVTIPEGVHGSLNWKYQDSFLPATVVPFLFNIMMVYSSSALSMEITTGLLERYQCAGLTLQELLSAQMSLQMIVISLQNILMITVVYGLFRMVIVGSMVLILVIVMVTELLGLMFGIILSLVVHNETAVSSVGLLIQLGTFMYCGCSWPIEGQHWVVQFLGNTTPLVPLSKSYFNVALRGWGLNHYQVYGNILESIFGSLLLGVITVILVRYNVIRV